MISKDDHIVLSLVIFGIFMLRILIKLFLVLVKSSSFLLRERLVTHMSSARSYSPEVAFS